MYVNVECPECGYVFEKNIEVENTMADLVLDGDDYDSYAVELICPKCGCEFDYELTGDELENFRDEASDIFHDYFSNYYETETVLSRLKKSLMRDKRKIKRLWLKYLEDEDYEDMKENDIIKIIELAVKLKTGLTIHELTQNREGWKEIHKLEETLNDEGMEGEDVDADIISSTNTVSI